MKKKLNPIMNFVEAFRSEPFSYVLCYVTMAILIIGLFQIGSASSQLGSILSISFGVFSAIYVSFSVQRRDIDQLAITRRKRVSYLVSAVAFLLIYLRLGFPEILAGPTWSYAIISTILFLAVAPVVAGNSSSEQAEDGKPDHVPS